MFLIIFQKLSLDWDHVFGVEVLYKEEHGLDLPSEVLQDVFLQEHFCPSAVWYFMTTNCHLGSSASWECGDFLFLEACHHSVNKHSGSTLPDLSIPELGTDFARGQKYVCCCRYSIWSYISHLFEFIGLCLHFYSISTFRGCWFISTLYLSFKMWTNLKLIPAAERLSWCFFAP